MPDCDAIWHLCLLQKCQVKLTIVGRGGGKVAYCGEKDKKKA